MSFANFNHEQSDKKALFKGAGGYVVTRHMTYQQFYFGCYSLSFRDNWVKSFLVSEYLTKVLYFIYFTDTPKRFCSNDFKSIPKRSTEFKIHLDKQKFEEKMKSPRRG